MENGLWRIGCQEGTFAAGTISYNSLPLIRSRSQALNHILPTIVLDRESGGVRREHLATLDRARLLKPPRWLPSNVQYETIMGSVAYGVSSDTSDVDLYGWAIPPKDDVFHIFGARFLALATRTSGSSNSRNTTSAIPTLWRGAAALTISPFLGS